jgi:hypothetical protein
MNAIEKTLYADALDYELESLCNGDTVGELVILSANHDGCGTVAIVYELDGIRHYHAMEYTLDGHEHGEQWLSPAYGYSTTDTACYMGQRYAVASLWGPYFDEIFTHCGTTHNPA